MGRLAGPAWRTARVVLAIATAIGLTVQCQAFAAQQELPTIVGITARGPQWMARHPNHEHSGRRQDDRRD